MHVDKKKPHRHIGTGRLGSLEGGMVVLSLAGQGRAGQDKKHAQLRKCCALR